MTTEKKRKEITDEVLEAASILAKRFRISTTPPSSNSKITHPREARRRNKKKTSVTETSKRCNIKIMKQTFHRTGRMVGSAGKQIILRTIESSGAIPRIFKSDRTFGYIRIRSVCMVPIKENEPFALSAIKWPFFYCMSDLEPYNQKLHTRRYFHNRKKNYPN